MATYTTTALNALRWLPGGNLASDIDAGFQALAEDVDARLGAHGYAEVNTSESRNNVAAGDLATVGPSVTVTVPTNGLVGVYAAVAMTTGVGPSGFVDLYEDGVVIGTLLVSTVNETRYTAPGRTSFDGVNTRNAGAWVTFPATAASHAYKLMYRTTGGSVAFATRRLWVRALPS